MDQTHNIAIYYLLEKNKTILIGPLLFGEQQLSMLSNDFEYYVTNADADEPPRQITNGKTYWYETPEGQKPIALRLDKIVMMGPLIEN